MHAISSYRGNRPTHTHPRTHKQTGPITVHCAAASAQCNDRTAVGTAITKSIGQDSGRLLDNYPKPNGTPVTVYWPTGVCMLTNLLMLYMNCADLFFSAFATVQQSLWFLGNYFTLLSL